MTENYKQKYIDQSGEIATYKEIVLVLALFTILFGIGLLIESAKVDNLSSTQNYSLNVSSQLACVKGCVSMFEMHTEYNYEDYHLKDQCKDDCIRTYGFEYQKQMLGD